jgi:integrase
VSDEILPKNPCQVRGAAVEKAPERPIASIAEVDALAAAMPEHLRIAVYLAAWCQLRRGEIRGLRRQDLDLAKSMLSVRVTKTTAMSGRTIVKEPKTRAGRRTIAVPPHIVDLLSEHLGRFVPESPEAYVVDTSNRELSVAWHKARAVVGRRDLRFHDLRHSGLTWSAATGASVAELMRRAGHASQAAALRYQHATDDRDRVLADALADLAQRANGLARDYLLMNRSSGHLSHTG